MGGGGGTPEPDGAVRPSSVGLAGACGARGAAMAGRDASSWPSSKIWVASSSSSQSTSTPDFCWGEAGGGFAGEATAGGGAMAAGGGGAVWPRPPGGATTGGSELRPGGGGGVRRETAEGELADAGGKGGATIPSRVRLAASGGSRVDVVAGGGGGTLRVPDGGLTEPGFFPKPSKMSRSDPPLSFCAMTAESPAAHLEYHWSHSGPRPRCRVLTARCPDGLPMAERSL